MAALGRRGVYWKSVLPACPQIMFGRIRNKLICQNRANYSNLRPDSRSHSNYTCNISLSSLSANSFVLQNHHLRSRFYTCLQTISTRNKTSFTSVFLPAVCKNDQSFHSPLAQLLNTSSLLLRSHPTCFFEVPCRFKQKKRDRKSQEEETFSDDETDALEEEFEEESDLPLNYKQLKIYVKSPRADALLSTGLNISRAKVDSIFYANKLLHNDKPLTKKSKNLDEGDYVDLITDGNGSGKLKRVKVLKISSERGRTDKMCVVLRAWRSPFSLVTVDEES